MKIIKQFIVFSTCSMFIIGCGGSAIDEGTPIQDPSADADAETTPPTPEELETMRNESQSE